MQLELLEGRVFGARYYTVRPAIGWDLVNDWGNLESWPKMVEWCVESFGPTPDDGIWTPGSRWYVNNAKFWFRNEIDRTVFVLKWQ
jgi:hypothetical protein